ncbi:MAG: methyltransferase domain-containing protein [Desulfosoma sp.]
MKRHHPLRDVFEKYQSTYERRGGKTYFRPLHEVLEFRLGRLPAWLDRIPKNARILDAGCATGYLLGLLYELGYTQLTGVDISKEMTDTARQRLPATIVIHCEDIFDFVTSLADESFDLILFHQVIEHIPREQIIDLLRHFHRCLSPGGWLSVTTPNAACVLAGCHVAGDITHVTAFNELSLKQVAEQAGFKPDAFEIVLTPPRLFWSWRHPHRAVLRLLNRARWHLNRFFHWSLIMLIDSRPMLLCREWELQVLMRK